MTALASQASAGAFHGGAGLIDADEVEARLVEAWRTYRRLDGRGDPFAKDGPWREMTLGFAERYNAHQDAVDMGDMVERVLQSPRPDRDMIGRAQAAVGWLALIPDDGKRKLVNLATQEMELRGGVDWRRMLRKVGRLRGAEGLRVEYRQALHAIAFRLNG